MANPNTDRVFKVVEVILSLLSAIAALIKGSIDKVEE